MSKQTQTPILPNSVSNRVSSLPGVRVDLAVPRHLVALPVEDEAGVVQLLPVQLGEGAAHHPDVVGAGGGRKRLPDRAAGGLGVGAEILMLIGTAEHLRQYRQVCPLSCRRGDLRHSVCHVLGFVQHGAHLDQSSFHVDRVLSNGEGLRIPYYIRLPPGAQFHRVQIRRTVSGCIGAGVVLYCNMYAYV